MAQYAINTVAYKLGNQTGRALWLELNAALDEDFGQLHEAADGDKTA
jgi:hypothetical protein